MSSSQHSKEQQVCPDNTTKVTNNPHDANKANEQQNSSDQLGSTVVGTETVSASATTVESTSQIVDRGGKVNFDTITPYQQALQQRLPKTFWLILLMAITTCFSGFANNSFTPAINAIAEHFNTTLQHIQEIIAYYSIGMGAGQLFWGPFMDRYGRKILIILCGVFGLGVNFWITQANTFTELQICRFLQGMMFSGLSIVPRVMLRDIFPPRKYIIYNSWIVTIFLFAPVAAPLIGGYIYLHFGWHNIFHSVSIALILVMALFIKFIPETLDPSKKQSFKLPKILSNYWFILTTPNSLFLLVINIIYTVPIISFPTLLPAIYMVDYGVSPQNFGYCLIVNLVTISFGVQVNQIFIRKGYNPALIWRNAAILLVFTTSINFIVSWYFLSLPGIMLAIGVNLLYNGFLNGNLLSIYLLDYSNMTGTANSLATAMRLVIGGLIVSHLSHIDRLAGATLLHTNAGFFIVGGILITLYCLIYRPQDRAKVIS
ncbi:MFS transporter [Psittacicella hinzii]|uniref:Major facilitator superfamily (MFS) profile domain-containing protein n=1 Tax=Psittacicella hinzii TaxID=2028575 RepID=A0A3A1YKL1_9GAMM|nr:MFS transporter [Psittacicella hinzii]RIY38722.1 hypothetical protein CKF58_03555 [Psittacicella hinzii]